MIEITQQEYEKLKRYALIFETTEDAILFTDTALKIVEANGAAEKVFGYSRAEMIGVKVTSFYPDTEYAQKMIAEIRSSFFQHMRWNGHSRLLMKNGSIKTFDHTIIGVLNAEGEFCGHYSVMRDISDRVKAEAEVALLTEMLEKKVRARTEQFENSIRDLNDFAYIVSHDLKAPLRAIHQLTTWIVDDYAHLFDDDGREQMQMLCSRVDRMNTLIDGVLQYSRAGKDVSVETVDLAEVFADLQMIFSTSNTISLSVCAALPVLKANRTHIVQIFQNLISNAEKFMDKPRGEVKVICTLTDSDLCITISDNGPGIDKKYHTAIFQMFNTVSQAKTSSGVGLALVKKIVSLYGGKISVDSAPGQGAAFSIVFSRDMCITCGGAV